MDALTSDDGRRAAGPGPAATGPAADAAGLAARDSYGRLLALLSASTSDIAAAEDALADAFERALRTWPAQGVPASPDAWLLTVARNRLRDHWRSAQAQRAVPLDDELDALVHTDDLDVDALPDRRLELMLVCAHPAIDRTAHTPLMLNTVLGFTAEQIGRAFSVPASTMATRLVRAKKRIKAARIPFRIPDRADLPARMDAVLEAVYGAYVIDWATTGPQARPLPSEALHLAEVLTRCAPGDPEAHGLAALVQLSASRAPARLDAAGRFVPLPDQDPSRWDSHLIDRAHEHLRAAHARGQLGRFQLEAAIQAVHCARRRAGPTDWPTLLTLHRAAARDRAVARQRRRPRRRHRRGRGSRGRPGHARRPARRRRPARPPLPARPGHPRAPARPARTERGSRGRLRPRDRSDSRHRRTPVPAAPP